MYGSKNYMNMKGSGHFTSENRQDYFVSIYTHPRWRTDIKPIVLNMCDKKYNNTDVVVILNRFREEYAPIRQRLGQNRNKSFSYEALLRLYAKELLALVANLAFVLLVNEGIDLKLPMLSSGKTIDLYLKKKEVFLILVFMFFCLIPKQQSDYKEKRGYNYQTNFSHILTYNDFKTSCIVEYFLEELPFYLDKKQTKYENLKISRICHNLNTPLSTLIKRNERNRLCSFDIESNDSNIQDHFNKAKTSFANCFIGGGSLRNGLVQEQIMFATHPEMFISPLFCEKIESNEAIIFYGFKKYFKCKGYKDKTTFMGRQKHKYTFNRDQIADEVIISIDASIYTKEPIRQYERTMVDREILKAYIGFSSAPGKQIVSGNWGCGAFGGDIQLKLMIQWIAASMANKLLVYCPFGSSEAIYHDGLKTVRKLSIGEIYNYIIISCEKMMKSRGRNRLTFYDCLF